MFEWREAILIDLDGVLYVEDEVVDGASEAVERFRDLGLALRFVTNTTARSRDSTREKLARLGFLPSSPAHVAWRDRARPQVTGALAGGGAPASFYGV